MTVKVTITHAEPNSDKTLYAKKINGNLHEPLVPILPGKTIEMYVYIGQDILVTEKQ